jgi:hypothetical protein
MQRLNDGILTRCAQRACMNGAVWGQQSYTILFGAVHGMTGCTIAHAHHDSTHADV